jgi:molybdenum cofactor synthesis domain-containing protein
MGKWFSETKRSLSCDYKLLPDNSQKLETEIRRMVSEGHEIIITTGGTGIGPRDFTPDVVKPLLDKEIPGIMDYIRLKYGAEKPNALLSRSIAGVSGKSLIFVLPGSVKAVKEYMSEILPMLNHLFAMIFGIDRHIHPFRSLPVVYRKHN